MLAFSCCLECMCCGLWAATVKLPMYVRHRYCMATAPMLQLSPFWKAMLI